MKIVAKTRMKGIPKTCKVCSISYIDPWGERCCGINKRDCPVEVKPSGNVGYGKPSWCPLVVLKDGDEDGS
jgi:hypothetical protein